MKENFTFYNSLTVGIIIIFFCSSFVSSISGFSEDTDHKNIDMIDDNEFEEDVLVTCITFGLSGKPSYENNIPRKEAELLYEKIEKLQIEVARDPLSDKSQQFKREIITNAKEHNLLPKGVSTDKILTRLTPINTANKPIITLPRAPGRVSEMFCNYVSTGTGSALPIIIFPRLVPILLTPIPRLFVRWSTYDGITSCGGLRSGKGFIASGAQRGIALGFWGLGFSIFLPPVKAYGLFGYALYASVNAENITFWPPNYSPEVTMLNPPNGAENVPVATSELSFHISDVNKALMNYTVTTTPDVGSGSGSNKPDGTYSIPISGLEGSEEYTWYIHVDDGVNEIDVYSSFTTEAVAPMVSDPKPEDGERYVSLDLSQLSFHLSDPQGDLMDYTVETVPDIGSGSGTGVGEGTYSVNVNGLDYSQEYIWFVNATDGTNWKHKVLSFQTEPIMVFDPFEEGWKYRKKITIDRTQVTGNLKNFPVLMSTVDSDLRDKAQDDGDDILFMNDTGVATRLYHEIEYFDSSSGELIAWVNITNLDSDQDTTFYIYYGNLDCCNQQAPEQVWSSKYLMVQHMDDEPDNSHIRDSTYYDNDGVKKKSNEPIEIKGKIGKSQNFDGSNDYIDTKDFDICDNFTVSVWINPSSTNDDQCFVGKHTSGKDNILLFGYWEKDTNGYHINIRKTKYRDGILTTGWHHVVLVGKKISSFITSTTVYKNGVMLWQYDLNDVVGNTLGKPWTIGQDWDPSGRTDFFNGIIDEVRIFNSIKNFDWISTEYNNQNNPSKFLSFGPEETD